MCSSYIISVTTDILYTRKEILLLETLILEFQDK